MISFHAALSPDRRSKKTMIADSSRKRKWGDVVQEEEDADGEERSRSKVHEFSAKKRPGSVIPGSSPLDTELRLEESLPVERRRCLDIQSGEVCFHDARTNKRTCKGPTTTSSVRRTVSLNLELNLQPYDEYLSPLEDQKPMLRSLKEAEQRIDEEEEEEEEEEGEEMVATVCGRCHMLVMLCVSRPCCPNCKYLNPKPDQTPFTPLFKPSSKCTTTTAQLLC